MRTSGTFSVRTSGTLGNKNHQIATKLIDVPYVCHMCAHTCDVPEMLKNEKYGQFPFQRWHKRQNRTFLAPCGFACFLAKNHHFDEKSRISAKVAENRKFLLPSRKLSYSGNEKELEGARTTVGKEIVHIFHF